MRATAAVRLAKFAFLVLLVAPAMAVAAEVKVLTGSGLRPVLEEIGPEFERSTKHKLAIEYSSTMATKRKIEAGESFDVAIVGTPVVVDELVKQGKLAARTIIARSAMGVAVREGAAKPAIDSSEAFKRMLLNAKSVAYNSEGATTEHIKQVLARLGIAGEMTAKMRPVQGADRVIQSVATGDAELGLSVSATILSTRGVHSRACCRQSFKNTWSTPRQ